MSYDFSAFVAVIDGRDLDDLAHRAGVGVESIRAIAAGDVPPSPSVQMRLAAALGKVNPFDLFRLDDDTEAALDDVEAQDHPRYVADSSALRTIDRATR